MKLADYMGTDDGRIAWRAATLKYGRESRAAVLALLPDDDSYATHDEWWPEWAVDGLLDGEESAGQEGLLYFVCSETMNGRHPFCLKVGFTARHPLQRLCELQRISPVPLFLHAVTFGTRADEATIHRLLARHRTHGEWFRMSGDIGDRVWCNCSCLPGLYESLTEAD